MAFINEVFIAPSALLDIKKWKLEKFFEKACAFLVHGNYTAVQLRKREPKHKNIWYFRLNKQFRAWCMIENGQCQVFSIDDHQ